jgi:hypothetical protein
MSIESWKNIVTLHNAVNLSPRTWKKEKKLFSPDFPHPNIYQQLRESSSSHHFGARNFFLPPRPLHPTPNEQEEEGEEAKTLSHVV